MRSLVLVVIAACGRLGFDDAIDGGPSTVDGARARIDAPAGDALSADSGLPSRLVFLTPSTYLGSLSGMNSYSALDALCTSIANGSGHPGTYAVVLAFAGMNASAHVTLADGRTIVLVDGTAVATDSTFFTASHVHPIDLDIAGSADMINMTAWTDFQADGTALGSDCSGWTDSSSGTLGGIGSTIAVDQTWADNGTARCNRVSHLICIEQ